MSFELIVAAVLSSAVCNHQLVDTERDEQCRGDRKHAPNLGAAVRVSTS